MNWLCKVFWKILSMRYLVFIVAFSLCSPIDVYAQADTSQRFGIKGGFNKTYFNVYENGHGLYATSETGYYYGVFMEIPIDEFLTIQPEALYISIGDFNFLNVPIYAKYEVVNRLNLMAGPSMNYFFDFFTNKFKVAADISSSYGLSPTFDFHVKFTLGLDELAPNGLFFGVGLKL